MKPIQSNLSRRRAVVSLFLVFALCFVSIPYPGFAFQNELSQSDRSKIFDKVWTLISDRYYDPKMNGVNWDSQKEKYEPLISKVTNDLEFYDTVKKMVGEMNDAHTRFLTPREARERRARRGTTAGILLSRVEGKTVVEKVLQNAKGDLNRVKPGMIVRTIDGVAVEERFKEAGEKIGGSSSKRALEILTYRRMMRGEPGTSVKVGLTAQDGKDFDVELTRVIVPETSEAIAKVLPSGLGYIAVTSFKAPISNKFRKAVSKLKDTPGLIIDLRYNGGGSINEVLTMAGYFLDKKYGFGKFMRRNGGSRQSLRKFSAGKKGRQLYSKPLIVLTSKFSASGSELFASSLQELGRARVVGSQTCGCLLGISRKHRLRGGSELHISDIGFISAKGNIYEKVGVTPNKVIEPKIVDLIGGFDRGIAEAENILSDAASVN